jgi:hypothetical protein
VSMIITIIALINCSFTRTGLPLLKARWIPRGILLPGLIVHPSTPTHSDSREMSPGMAWNPASHILTEPTVKLGVCYFNRCYSVELTKLRRVAVGPMT